jgi:hypothetical protein
MTVKTPGPQTEELIRFLHDDDGAFRADLVQEFNEGLLGRAIGDGWLITVRTELDKRVLCVLSEQARKFCGDRGATSTGKTAYASAIRNAKRIRKNYHIVREIEAAAALGPNVELPQGFYSLYDNAAIALRIPGTKAAVSLRTVMDLLNALPACQGTKEFLKAGRIRCEVILPSRAKANRLMQMARGAKGNRRLACLALRLRATVTSFEEQKDE